MHIPNVSPALTSISDKSHIAPQVATTASDSEPLRRRSAGVGDQLPARAAVLFQTETLISVEHKFVGNAGTLEMV